MNQTTRFERDAVMRTVVLGFCICAAAITAFAQPSVPKGGVLNSASYALQGLPNSGIAQGSIFVVFGTGLGPSTLQKISTFPIQTTLGGTSVQVTSGGHRRRVDTVHNGDTTCGDPAF